MMADNSNGLGEILRQRRVMMRMTLSDLAAATGVSASHLARIERGNRLASGHALRKIAKPLGFEEMELLTLAGFLSPVPTEIIKEISWDTVSRLDPYTASVLRQEPVVMQRAMAGILSILIILVKSMTESNNTGNSE